MPVSAEHRVEHQVEHKRQRYVGVWVRIGVQLVFSCQFKIVPSDVKNSVGVFLIIQALCYIHTPT